METISMSGKERRRLEVFSRVQAREFSLTKAAELLGISSRQAKRIWARYRDSGDAGLVHRLRGRASNRHVQPLRKEQALELYREKYAGYGPTLAAECMERDDGLAIPTSTLRRWLSSAELWKQQRRRKQHRRRRARREHGGELVQMDGSHHDWFEGRRGWAVLMVMIDDATGRVLAQFFENESWDSAATTLRRYTQKHGLPRALYVDRHSIYRVDREPTPEEILAEIEPKTQFGRAMSELGVELICAHSPQAKGRVERVNRTLQDRLVKELARLGASDLESANRHLVEEFLPRFNAQFARPAAKPADLHRTVDEERMLRVLSIQEQRVVMPDWTLRWHNGFLQLPRATAASVQPGDRVVVSEQLDGRRRVFAGEVELEWSPFRETSAAPAKEPRGPTGSSQGQRPKANHPWRGKLPAAPPEHAAAVAGSPCSAPAATFATLTAQPALRNASRPRRDTQHPK
jgi:transposase